MFAIITDHLRAPVAMFNANTPEVGLAEYATYDAFGFVNRRPSVASTAQPYPTNTKVMLETQSVAINAELEEVDFRVQLHLLDTATHDYAFLVNAQKGDLQIAGGPEGRVWSEWLRDTDGLVELGFLSGNTWTNELGVSAESFEYRRHSAGVVPMFTPLRFPGHYYDAESDLHNNWNRYYDPRTGRYLQPEPALQTPTIQASYAYAGVSLPTYAYAANNPVRYVDPTGAIVVIWGQDFSGGSDQAILAAMLGDLRTDPCSRDLLRALEGLPDTVYVRSGQGSEWSTFGYTERAGDGIVRVVMDSEYLGMGDSDITGTGQETLYHELLHAYLLLAVGSPDMDPDSQHALINGIERTGRGKRRAHFNKNSLIDQWKKCRERDKCKRQ